MLDLVPIAGLKRDEYKPRRMSEVQCKRLRDSVLAFGMVVPIVVRKEDMLVIGGSECFACGNVVYGLPPLDLPPKETHPTHGGKQLN